MIEHICEKCNQGKLVIRINKSTNSFFIGCSNFPACRNTISTVNGEVYKREDDLEGVQLGGAEWWKY